VKRHDETFACMGTRVRLLIEDPDRDPTPAGAQARRYLEDAARRLTRFDSASELGTLNRSRDRRHPASPLLRTAVAAALWAAEATDGLVDPTLCDEVCRAGYARSRTGETPAPLTEALAAAPTRRHASAPPRLAQRWRAVTVTDTAIERPPGLALDTGGTTKGLLADAVAHTLQRAGFAHFVADCGGDMRIGGTAGEPRAVTVEHPLTREQHATLEIADGAVATSGLGKRIWRRPRGGYAHHLLDPATGEPAWTGLIAVTATAPTALEAEALAKSALLAGPTGARARLERHGGLIVHDDGSAEHITPHPTPISLAA
jgi:thiamine biosynthesis lipoprotein